MSNTSETTFGLSQVLAIRGRVFGEEQPRHHGNGKSKVSEETARSSHFFNILTILSRINRENVPKM